MLRLRSILALSGAAAVAAFALSTGTAQAAPGVVAPQANVPAYTVTVPNKLIGFDAAIAKAHGYQIVTVNGVQESVKIGSSPAAITPNNTVYGDCGSSSISIYNEGNKTANVYWSFHVNNPAYYYDLNVAVTDRAGTGNKEFYGFLAGDYDVGGSWTNTKHSVTGQVVATISWGYVDEEDGAECQTLHPIASANLT